MDTSARDTYKTGRNAEKHRPWQLLLLTVAAALLLLFGTMKTISFLRQSSEPVNNRFIRAVVYTLRFHPNAQNDPVTQLPAEQVSYGQGVFHIPAQTPERAGCRFTGWNTQPDGSGTDVQPGTDPYRSEQTETNLYAQWEPQSFRLIYDANGGSNPPAMVEVPAATASHTFSIAAPGGMTGANAHKVFLGWALQAGDRTPQYAYQGLDHTGAQTLQSTLTLTAPEYTRTLYAVWGTRYSLAFDPNLELGGGGDVPATMTRISVEASEDFTIEEQRDDNTPTRPGGYRWGWWGVAADDYSAVTRYSYGDTITLYAANPSRTLYAFYQPTGECRLSFHPNVTDNSVSRMPPTQVNSTTEVEWLVTIPKGTRDEYVPTRNNYRFMGWSENPNASTGDYQPGEVFVLNQVKNHLPTLYAIWQPLHTFKVHFVYNITRSKTNGTDTATDGVYYKDASGDWVMNNWRYSYDYYIGSTRYTSQLVFSSGETMEPYYEWDAAFWAQTGCYAKRASDEVGIYEFLGWSTDKNADTPQYTLDANNCLTENFRIDCEDENCAGGTHDLVLYAVWKKTPLHTYRLLFAPNYSDDTVFNRNSGENVSIGGTIYSVKKKANGSAISISQQRYDVYELEPSSMDVDSVTWTAEELRADGPAASKKSTSTAAYKLIGWSYEQRSNRVDIPVDEDGYITQDISIEEPNPGSCDGARHDLLLFPVWKTVPLHTYNIVFSANLSGVYVQYYTEEAGKWMTASGTGNSFTDVFGRARRTHAGYTRKFTSGSLEAGVTQWPEEPASFWAPQKNGAYCKDQTTATGYHKFLGWAWEPDAPAPDILVDGNGFLTTPVFIDEHDEVAGLCADQESVGREHSIMLYGVWEYTPLNSYYLIFSANGGSKSRVHYYENGDWKTAAGATDRTPYLEQVVKPDGSVIDLGTGLSKTKRYEVKSIDARSNRSYTWYADPFFAANGVYASRDATATTKYTFLGWAYEPDATAPDILVNTSGFITSDITITDPYRYEDQGGQYSIVLYAVYREEAIHSFNLYFDRNAAGGVYTGNVRYRNTGNTGWNSAAKAYDDLVNLDGTVLSDRVWGLCYSETLVSTDVCSKVWEADSFWSTNGVYATRADTDEHTYKFLGWALKPDATEEEIVYHVNDDGYITDDIRMDVPHAPGDCEGGVHNLVLFAVWKEHPNKREYTVYFSANGGSNPPSNVKVTEWYDEENGWQESCTIPIPDAIPTKQRFAFVGWSKDKGAAIGEYGHPNTSNDELALITQDLSGTISIPASSSTRYVTLYAVWRYEYVFNYNANGGTGAPPQKHAYTTAKSYNYEVARGEGAIPEREGYTFLGWSRNAEDTVPECSPYTNDGYPMGITVTGNSNGYTEITVYAIWAPNASQNSSAEQESSLTAAAWPESDPAILPPEQTAAWGRGEET